MQMSEDELQLFEEKENEELATRFGHRIGKVGIFQLKAMW